MVDTDVLFRSVEISPRWYFTGVDTASETVGYGGDGNHVSYSYSYNPKENTIRLKTTGKFGDFIIRVPFHAEYSEATAILNDSEVESKKILT